MKTYFKIIISILLLFSSMAFADGYKDKYLPRCGGVYSLCGYIDRETKEEVIPLKFDKTFHFYEDVALVSKGGLYGYINREGELIIKPKFELAGNFYQGLAEFVEGGKAGVINKKGEVVLEPTFARAIPFTKDTVIFEEGEYDDRGRPLEGVREMAYPVFYANSASYGIYNFKTKKKVAENYAVKPFDKEGKGLIWASKSGRNSEKKFGLLNSKGEWIIKPRFEHVQGATNHTAVVGGFNMKRGVINSKGEIVVPLEFDQVTYSSNGIWPVWKGTYKDHKEGYVVEGGKLVGGKYFDKIEIQKDSKTFKVTDSGETYCIDISGIKVDCFKVIDKNKLLKLECDSGVKVEEDLKGELNVYKPDGNIIGTAFKFYNAKDRLSCDAPILYIIKEKTSGKNNGEYNFINSKGEILSKKNFSSSYSFRDEKFEGGKKVYFSYDSVPVSIGDKWGVIDTSGNIVIPFVHEKLSRRTEGDKVVGYYAKNGEIETWFNAKGEKIEKPAPRPRAFSGLLNCAGNSTIFRKGRYWGIKASDGAIVIEPKHEAISCFKNGVAWVPNDSEAMWCPIGPDKKRAENVKCKRTYYPQRWSHYHPEKIVEDPYRNSVIWTRSYLEFANGDRKEAPKMVGDGVMGHGTRGIDGSGNGRGSFTVMRN